MLNHYRSLFGDRSYLTQGCGGATILGRIITGDHPDFIKEVSFCNIGPGSTALMNVCCYRAQRSQCEEVKFLLERGANINHTAKISFSHCGPGILTPLGVVIRSDLRPNIFQQYLVAELLLQKGANPNLGEDNVFQACKQNQPELVKLLLKYGADINRKNAAHKNMTALQYLQANNDPNLTDKNQMVRMLQIGYQAFVSEEAEVRRIAEQQRIVEQQRIAAEAEQQRVAAEAEQQRIVEQQRIAAEVEQQQNCK